MKVYTWEEFISSSSRDPLATTIGVFDGFHLGHQALIQAVRSESPALVPYVITFRENPKKMLHRSSYKGSLLTAAQKLAAISAFGIEHCVLIDFSDNFATLAGREFLTTLYLANVQFVTVGENFQFGYKLDTDATKLVSICDELGMRSSIVKSVMYRGHPVSSSRIRHAVLEGKLNEASEMLGRPYQLPLAREGSKSEGSEAVFTPGDDLVLPPDGMYNAIVLDGGDARETVVSVAHRYITIGLRMRSDSIRLAFVDKATQEKENLVWL